MENHLLALKGNRKTRKIKITTLTLTQSPNYIGGIIHAYICGTHETRKTLKKRQIF